MPAASVLLRERAMDGPDFGELCETLDEHAPAL